MTSKDFDFSKTVLVHSGVTLLATGRISLMDPSGYIDFREKHLHYDIEILHDTRIEGDIKAKYIHILGTGKATAENKTQ